MVSLADIRAAEKRISGHVIRTPLVFSPSLSARTGARVYLKLESLQKAGSFKVRGATNKILVNTAAAREHGVVAASAGNHAQGCGGGGPFRRGPGNDRDAGLGVPRKTGSNPGLRCGDPSRRLVA